MLKIFLPLTLSACLSVTALAQNEGPKLPSFPQTKELKEGEIPKSDGAPKEMEKRNPEGAGSVKNVKHPTYSELMKPKDPNDGNWDKIELRDSEGKKFAIKDYRGKLVLINFFFTHCPDVCPPQTAALNTVKNKLGKFEQDSVQFISITIDPDNDTQKALQKYKNQFAIKGENWTFARTDKEALKKLGTHFAAISGDPEKPLDHRARLYLIKDDGSYLLSYEAAPVDIERMTRDLTDAVRNFIKPKS